jgi:translation initiation factor IF-2
MPASGPLARNVGSALAGPPQAQPPAGGAPAAAGTRPGAISRDDYIGPGGTTGKPRLLGARPLRPGAGGGGGAGASKSAGDAGKPAGRREPVVKLAAIPKSGEAPAPRGPAEPAAQKPIMTLPLDAIRGAKSGSAAPLEQFTRQHEKKRQDKERDSSGTKKPPGRFAPAAEFPPPADPEGAGHRDRRKSKTGGPFEPEDDGKGKLAGMGNARTARQQSRRRKDLLSVDEEDADSRSPLSAASRRQRQAELSRRHGGSITAPRKGKLVVELPCTVRSLSEATGIPFARIQRTLMALGTMATINSSIDAELAELVAAELGLDIELRQPPSLEDRLLEELRNRPDAEEQLVTRPPVVTFLGHVDHGKTSLLDRIIGINVVSGEAGGITQHIRAYSVEWRGRRISFVDTPGHEAFTEMRARGAHVTDIAVLVVAADDGVMPQTVEAISHAKAAGVPIVVALNKIDLPGANPVKAMQDLTQYELLPTEWGGDVEVIKTSAVAGTGIDDLLETLLLTADIHEYRANPNRPAMGTCLEAQQEGDRGVVAKVIVQNGTLNVGDIVVCGAAYGRVKAMTDTLQGRQRLKEAGPSIPVNLTGLDSAPEAGEPFYVLQDITQARTIAEKRAAEARGRSLAGRTVRVSFEEFQRRLSEGSLSGQNETVTLNLILRADVRGSIEALEKELSKLHHPEVRINLLQKSVGGVTSADVTLAAASDAVIVGFNVIPDEAARQLADERGVEIRRYEIIYKVTEDLKAMLEGKLKPEEQVKELGRALVQRVFSISRVGTVAGCRVLAGTIERNCRVRVNRDGRGIGDYPLESLKREKDDAREVREGMECGMKLGGFNDLKEGDVLEAYKIEEIARTL